MRCCRTSKTVTDAPKGTSQDGSQVVELSEPIGIRVREAIPVSNALEPQYVGNGDIREVMFQHTLARDLHNLTDPESEKHTRLNAYIPVR